MVVKSDGCGTCVTKRTGYGKGAGAPGASSVRVSYPAQNSLLSRFMSRQSARNMPASARDGEPRYLQGGRRIQHMTLRCRSLTLVTVYWNRTAYCTTRAKRFFPRRVASLSRKLAEFPS